MGTTSGRFEKIKFHVSSGRLNVLLAWILKISQPERGLDLSPVPNLFINNPSETANRLFLCVCVLGKALWWDNSAVGEGRHSLLAHLGLKPLRCQSVSYCSQVQSPTELRGSRRDFEPQTVFRKGRALSKGQGLLRFSSAIFQTMWPFHANRVSTCPRRVASHGLGDGLNAVFARQLGF